MNLNLLILSATLVTSVLASTGIASTLDFITSERVNVHELRCNMNTLTFSMDNNTAFILPDATVGEALANLII
ncbi:hypothetical protein [Pseudoalteromonas aurantia]|uniref:Uncharacterized protein n=1 Tax=Pseudoalteromonas aurantia TaxID=43654 RepID=A0ABY2VZH8_9GAMM|nr:hypothetical protein [Pseudoalteromonas aurantia]TMO75810.1 hypothetical protein CWC20_07565 [Pseudoalteromonas aurantia]